MSSMLPLTASLILLAALIMKRLHSVYLELGPIQVKPIISMLDSMNWPWQQLFCYPFFRSDIEDSVSAAIGSFLLSITAKKCGVWIVPRVCSWCVSICASAFANFNDRKLKTFFFRNLFLALSCLAFLRLTCIRVLNLECPAQTSTVPVD